eukprot:8351139-Pyramimonas_sp.AAC.1
MRADLKSVEGDSSDLSSQDGQTPAKEDVAIADSTPATSDAAVADSTPATRDAISSDSDSDSEKKSSIPPSPQDPQPATSEALSIDELRAQVAKLREQTASVEQAKAKEQAANEQAAKEQERARQELQELKELKLTDTSFAKPSASSGDWTVPKLTFPPFKLDGFLQKWTPTADTSSRLSSSSSLLRDKTPISFTL